MNISAIIEARMTSSRLPGKILKKIGQKECLMHTIHRLQMIKDLDNIIVATTSNYTDDIICDLCELNNISYFRGSENNVLNRVLSASKYFNVDVIVEITGDSIFIDYQIIEESIKYYINGGYDFVANCVDKPMYIPGFDVRIFSTNLLESVEKKIIDEEDYEHVSSFFWKNPESFVIKHVRPPKNLESGDFFLGLDTQQDLDLLTKIYEVLGDSDRYFDAYEIIKFLNENIEIAKKNAR